MGHADALASLGALLSTAGEGRGEVHLRLDLGDGGWAELQLAHNRRLDADLCAAVSRIAGVAEASLKSL